MEGLGTSNIRRSPRFAVNCEEEEDDDDAKHKQKPQTKRRRLDVDATETRDTERDVKRRISYVEQKLIVSDEPPVLLRTMFSWKDAEIYTKELRSSQGFDATPRDGISGGDYITPLQLEDSFFNKCSREAVKLHNESKEDEVDDSEDRILFQAIGIGRNKAKPKEQCGKVEFSKLTKMNANRQGYMFITMECKDLDDEGKIKQYQSILENLPQPDAFRLKMFRLKPQEESTTSGTNTSR